MGAAFNNLMEEETKESLANMVLDLMGTAARQRTALGELFIKADKYRKTAEQLEVQLAGCSVAASGWSTKSEGCVPGKYGYSIAYQDVLDLREKYEALLKDKSETPEKRYELNAPPVGWVWTFNGLTEVEIIKLQQTVEELKEKAWQYDELTK